MRGAPYAKLEPVNVRKGQEMALTEYEKKVLEQMEASLREEDPALASQMSAPAPAEETEPEPQRGPRAPRRIALGFAGAVLGMVLLVVAVSLGYSIVSILIGVAGFAVTVAARRTKRTAAGIPSFRIRSAAGTIARTTTDHLIIRA